MYAIQATGLTKRFRRRRVVDGLDMHVARGDVYGLIGRNGSGKTTTMRMIAGLMPPDAGEVAVLGRPLAPCEAHPFLDALIESPGIYENLSAFDNVMAKALALGVVDPNERCRSVLEAVGLADTGKQKARRFSMGMKHRLGIALALVGRPDVLVLDEPMNGLDPEGARDVRSLLMRLNRERGVTVLISSHILDQLERMCTRYGVIRDGRIVAELTAEEVDAACASCLVLHCSEPARACALLADRAPGLEVKVLEDDALRISDDADEKAVGELMMAEGIAVFDLHRLERDREEFFVHLMGDGASGASEKGGER